MKKKTRAYRDANWPDRVLASLIDKLIVAVPQAILLKMLGMNGPMLLASFLIELVYYTHFTASAWQATPGQRMLNIFVIRQNGRPLALSHSLERYLAFILPTLPVYCSFIPREIAGAVAGWLIMMWLLPIVISEKRLGMHDKLCGTRVVTGRVELK